MSAGKTLLPQRHPNRDFFIADILDAMPKSDMGSLEHPIFSLSKKPDMTERHYEHNGNTLDVIPSGRGMANIWDKDVLIFCVSQLVAGINRNRGDVSQTVRVTAYELLKATNRYTGGKNYQQLEDALIRLRGTTLRTNIQTDGQTNRRGFGLIEHYNIVERGDDGRMAAVEIKLSDWLYRSATGLEVLSLNPKYFRLAGALERRIYELARKHCGSQTSWKVGVELLKKKTGARSPLKRFRHEVKRIASSDILPDYRMAVDTDKDQIVFYNKKSPKAAKAQAMDELAKLGYKIGSAS